MDVHRRLNQEVALMCGKAHLAPIRHMAEWAPEPVWTFWRRGNSPAVTGTRTPDRLAYSLVTTPTELSGCWYSVFFVPVKYRLSFQPNCYGSCLQIK